jgi:hypothetical protein
MAPTASRREELVGRSLLPRRVFLVATTGFASWPKQLGWLLIALLCLPPCAAAGSVELQLIESAERVDLLRPTNKGQAVVGVRVSQPADAKDTKVALPVSLFPTHIRSNTEACVFLRTRDFRYSLYARYKVGELRAGSFSLPISGAHHSLLASYKWNEVVPLLFFMESCPRAGGGIPAVPLGMTPTPASLTRTAENGSFSVQIAIQKDSLNAVLQYNGQEYPCEYQRGDVANAVYNFVCTLTIVLPAGLPRPHKVDIELFFDTVNGFRSETLTIAF